MRVADKIAIVTGGASGIGAECARTLVREGASVVIADISEEAGAALARKLGATYLRHDVTSLDSWRDIVAMVLQQHGRIDILVHCAGIVGNVKQSCLDTTPEEWNRVIQVNLTGTFWGCKAVVPEMLKRGTGSVVLLSSIVSYMATSVATPYGVSKAGVQQLTRSVAIVGAKAGSRVRCNSVHPGSIRSPMTDGIIADLAQAQGLPLADAERALMSGVPFGMRGEPSDVANLVLYLASDEAKYVTGSDFKVDGGWHIVDAG